VILSPNDVCRCKRKHPTGRWYMRYEACLCGHLIVLSQAELRELRQMEDKQVKRERTLAVPETEPVERVGEDFAKMYPELAKRQGAA